MGIPVNVVRDALMSPALLRGPTGPSAARRVVKESACVVEPVTWSTSIAMVQHSRPRHAETSHVSNKCSSTDSGHTGHRGHRVTSPVERENRGEFAHVTHRRRNGAERNARERARSRVIAKSYPVPLTASGKSGLRGAIAPRRAVRRSAPGRESAPRLATEESRASETKTKKEPAPSTHVFCLHRVTMESNVRVILMEPSRVLLVQQECVETEAFAPTSTSARSSTTPASHT